MGQHNVHLQNISTTVTKVLDECGTAHAIVSDELLTMNYDEFLVKLGELNTLSQKCFDSDGHQLLFAVKKGSDSTILWKATIQIACVKIWPEDQKVISYRLLSFREFVKVFKTLRSQWNTATKTESDEEASQMLSICSNEPIAGTSKELDVQTECCICLERKMDVLLPCAHSYCLQCIEEWHADHKTCPICREKINSTDDTWVLSEVPKSEEISDEIKMTLMDLAEEKSVHCSPS